MVKECETSELSPASDNPDVEVPKKEAFNKLRVNYEYNETIHRRMRIFRANGPLRIIKQTGPESGNGNDIYIETDFTGYNAYVRDSMRYYNGLIMKCIYMRSGDDIKIYTVVIEGSKCEVRAIDYTFVEILHIENNGMLKEYISIDMIDNFFKSITTESLEYLIVNSKIEFSYKSQVDYIKVIFNKTITGPIHLNIISPGLSDECDKWMDLIEEAKNRRPECQCVIL